MMLDRGTCKYIFIRRVADAETRVFIAVAEEVFN